MRAFPPLSVSVSSRSVEALVNARVYVRTDGEYICGPLAQQPPSRTCSIHHHRHHLHQPGETSGRHTGDRWATRPWGDRWEATKGALHMGDSWETTRRPPRRMVRYIWEFIGRPFGDHSATIGRHGTSRRPLGDLRENSGRPLLTTGEGRRATSGRPLGPLGDYLET